MWIFGRETFLSIVKDRDSDRLLVRARFAGDIEALFPDAVVLETENSDYRFRALVEREDVAIALAKKIRDIDYPNFKQAVEDQARHATYTGVWGVMARAQDRRYGIPCLDDPEQFEFDLWPDEKEPDLLEDPICLGGPYFVPAEREEL